MASVVEKVRFRETSQAFMIGRQQRGDVRSHALFHQRAVGFHRAIAAISDHGRYGTIRVVLVLLDQSADLGGLGDIAGSGGNGRDYTVASSTRRWCL